ncbi:MAG: hypothetical protein U1E70_23180 [Acetobacteraceae bacterium]|nr:hypothetical protein [Pseudomonadota bacterium]
MAKRAPGPKKPDEHEEPGAAEIDLALIHAANLVLADYFFDPNNEAEYKARYPIRQSPPNKEPGDLRGDPPLIEDQTSLGSNPVRWRIDPLTSRYGVRVTLRQRGFSATIDGLWQLQHETLRNARVVQRSGSLKAIMKAFSDLLEEFAPEDESDEELEDVLAALTEGADSDEPPLFDETPEEPPPADVDDRVRLKQLVDQCSRRPKADIPPDDRLWLEMTPQLLPVLMETTVQAMAAKPRQRNRVDVCLRLLTLQLEFVRYRLDRGWDWAKRMLSDYQQRMIELGREETLDQQDWFALAAAMTEARVPVSDEVQQALAEAGMTIAEPAPPEELLASLRSVSAEMASMVDSPFDVIDALSSAGAVMPAALRSFMTTELALSPHAVLREAVPMMLLDADGGVRRSAAAAMEQIAGSDTVSPDWLRRAITVRNWIPPADRPGVDRAIQKARLAGVPIGPWPGTQPGTARVPPGDVMFYASVVDGSGAQSILAVSRSAKKGLVAGLLLKHGVGVADAWVDPEAPRRDINSMVKELKSAVVCDEVERAYVDTVVQHAIRAGLAHGDVPSQKVLEIAEYSVSPDWRDRGLDVAAEAAAMFDALDAQDRTPAAREASFRRMLDWMADHDVAHSWFEDHQDVHRLIATVPRTDNPAALRLVLEQVLPAQRLSWAERFLLIALWCQSASSMVHRGWARDFIILAHAVAGSEPLESIGPMKRIAEQTVLTARTVAW